jgi:hypothetical protein
VLRSQDRVGEPGELACRGYGFVEGVNPEPVERLQACPLLPLERHPPLPKPGPLELGAQEIRLTSLADLVAGPRHHLGFLPEDVQLSEDRDLAAGEDQVHVCSFHVGGGREPEPRRLPARDARLGASGRFPRRELSRPRNGLRQHDLPVRGVHRPDLDPVEAVVLDAQGQRGIGKGADLGRPGGLGTRGGTGATDVGAVRQGLGDEGRDLRVGVERGRDDGPEGDGEKERGHGCPA